MLTVEDGTGISNADTYATVAEADAYFAAFPNDDWITDTTTKEVALRTATRDIDLLFAAEWRGVPLTATQALAFPRDTAAVPAALKRATMQLAVQIVDGYSPVIAPEDDDYNVSEETVKLGNLEVITKKFQAESGSKEMELVRRFLYPLLAHNSGFVYARVVRG